MEDLGLKIEVEWLWIKDRQSKFEDSIMPQITLYLGHCKILNFPLEDALQLFPGLWMLFQVRTLK